MASRSSYEEKNFLIPETPLTVRLTIDRERRFAPIVRVAIFGEHGEHKNPLYRGAATHLLKNLRFDVANSRLLGQADMRIDYYSDYDLSLHIRYPNAPVLRYPPSLIDIFIRFPFGYLRILLNHGRSGSHVFEFLAKKIPYLIPSLAAILQRDRDPHARQPEPTTNAEGARRKEAYAILGVTEQTPWNYVKNRYRMLAKKLHPDANNGVDDGSFQQLQNAYDVLEEWHQLTQNR